MKLTEMIEGMYAIYKEHGEMDIKIDLLTENQSNYVKIYDLDVNTKGGFVTIDGEVGELKEFKSKLK